MYSEKTIKKYVNVMRKLIAYFTTIVNDIHVSISDGNNKIGHVLNVSTAAIITCPHCAECMWYCYDVRDCFRHGWDSSTIRARAINTAILFADRERYFREIDKAITMSNCRFFRYHVGGEIPDYDYFDHMVSIVRNNPAVYMWTYTKNYSVVNDWIANNGKLPENMTVMFSEWQGLAMVNPYNFPEFRFIPAGEKPNPEIWTCPGNCDICKFARRGCIAGETTQVLEH